MRIPNILRVGMVCVSVFMGCDDETSQAPKSLDDFAKQLENAQEALQKVAAPVAEAPVAAAPVAAAPVAAVVGTISVKVNEKKDNGKPWDAFKGLPDIAICVTPSGGSETCYNGKGEKLKPKCKNSLTCSFSGFDFSAGKASIRIVDVDKMANDPIGDGVCGSGETCVLGAASVTLSGGIKSAIAAKGAARGSLAPAQANVKSAGALKPAAVPAGQPVVKKAPPKPKTKLEIVTEQAKELPMGSIGATLGHEYWFLESKKNACPDSDDNYSSYYGVPDVKDEFERNELNSKKKTLKKEVTDSIFTIPVSDIQVGKYDFKKNQRTLNIRSNIYTFTGVSKGECECEWDPDERMTMCEMCDWEPDPIGEKKTSDALSIKVPISPEIAKELGSSSEVYDIQVLARVKSVVRHNKCVKSCLWGVCGNDNIGAGAKLKGSLVAVVIEAGGKVIYENWHEKIKVDMPEPAEAKPEKPTQKKPMKKGKKMRKGKKGKKMKKGKKGKKKKKK